MDPNAVRNKIILSGNLILTLHRQKLVFLIQSIDCPVAEEEKKAFLKMSPTSFSRMKKRLKLEDFLREIRLFNQKPPVLFSSTSIFFYVPLNREEYGRET